MKKYLFLLVSMLLTLSVSARHLSPTEALSRISGPQFAGAVGQSTATATRTLAYVVESEVDGVDASAYLFAEGDSGFVVVAADDAVTPVLGYSHGARFDAADMPESLRWWLDEMGRQVDYAVANNLQLGAPVSMGAPVEPLVKATWGQTDPYNLFTPVIDGTQTPTGCVATALCQIMNYYKWPAKPVGSNTYKKDGQEFTIDYSDITFDWDNITDAYTDESTEASKEAVSTLMKAVGYGVNMSYGKSGSGATNASVEKAMKTFFGYSDKYCFIPYEIVTHDEWQSMFYHMLSNGMPIFQTGRNGVWLSSGGHAFVCDGYDGNGYYHYNWGWDGRYNGYFLLTCLVPQGMGVGGAVGGYNYRQDVLLNLFPDDGKPYNAYKYITGKDFALDGTLSTVSLTLSAPIAVSNPQLGFGVKAVDGSETITPLGAITLDAASEWALPAGWLAALDTSKQYELRFYWSEGDGGTWSRLIPDMNSILGLIITPKPVGGILSYNGSEWSFVVKDVDEPDMSIDVTDITFDSGTGFDIVTDQPVTYSLTVKNPRDTHYFRGIHHYLYSATDPGKRVLMCNTSIELAPNEQRTFKYKFTNKSTDLTDGQYYLSFIEANSLQQVFCDPTTTYSVKGYESLSFDDGTFEYVATGDNTATLMQTVSGELLTGDVTIPATVTSNGVTYTVTAVNQDWSKLYDRSQLTSLNMQYPVETFTPSMVLGSYNVLKSLTIGEGTKYIEKRLFSSTGCKVLEHLSLPSTLDTIGDNAFYNCNMLKEVIIPDGVTKIGASAFYGCKALTKLTLSSKLQAIEKNTFYNCNVLTDLVLPDGIVTLGEGCFDFCYALVNVKFGSNIKTVGQNAFYSCNVLESVQFGNSLESVGASAFNGCKLLKSADLGNNVKTIGEKAFYNCNELTTLNLGQKLETVGDYAFYSCKLLTAINLAPTTVVVGNYAFSTCNAAAEITLGENLQTIGKMAFTGAKAVSSLTIPATVDSIGVSAFTTLSALKTLDFKSGRVDTIHEKAFYSCSVLESITLPEGVKKIGPNAFYGCNKVTYIDLPASLETIEDKAFYQSGFNMPATEIVSRAATPPVIAKTTFSSNHYNKGSLKVLPASVDLYTNDTDGWAQFKNIEGDPTTGIDDIIDDSVDTAAPQDVYDVTGRLVGRQMTEAERDALAPGLYIVGNRKVAK